MRIFRSKETLVRGEQVTEENMSVLAEWCGGTIKVYEPDVYHSSGNYRSGQKYIELSTHIQDKVFLGNWLICTIGRTDFRVYRTDSQFSKFFEEVEPENPVVNENDPLGLMELWSVTPEMPLGSFLQYVDTVLLREIKVDPFNLLRDPFEFFDSEEKPLKPREFLRFWNSLSQEERVYYSVETARPKMQPKGIVGIVGDMELVDAKRWI